MGEPGVKTWLNPLRQAKGLPGDSRKNTQKRRSGPGSFSRPLSQAPKASSVRLLNPESRSLLWPDARTRVRTFSQKKFAERRSGHPPGGRESAQYRGRTLLSLISQSSPPVQGPADSPFLSSLPGGRTTRR